MNAHTRHVAVVGLMVLAAISDFGCGKSGTNAEGSGAKPATAEKVAAGKDPAAKPAAEPAPAPEKIKLTVNDFGVFGYKPLYAEYQQSHPNIEIAESISEYNTHHSNLINHLAAGSGAADIEAVDEGFMAQLKARPDQFANLLDFGAADLEKNYPAFKWKASLSADGKKQIGLGTDVGGLAMCYRTDVFAKAKMPVDPAAVSALWPTWDKYVETGVKFMAAKTGSAFFDAATNLYNGQVFQLEKSYYEPGTNEVIAGTNPGVKAAWDRGDSAQSSTAPTSGAAVSPTSASTAPASAQVTLPPKHVPWDYQIGGAYAPAAGVRVVSRDHDSEPVPGVYSICNINAFQVQAGAEREWDSDLLLRDAKASVVYDKAWDEAILDIRTDAKRQRIAAKLNSWIDECAAKGYKAVEPDNYDTFTRYPQYLKSGQAEALMKLLSAHAHHKGLAIAQKNALELVSDRTSVGLDFAMVEGCAEWNECGEFAEAFGDNVLVVEYTAKGMAKACSGWGSSLSVVRRDEEVVPRGSSGYVHKTC